MPQIVVPAEDLIEDGCTELWADPDKLAADKSIEPDEAVRAVLEATWAIYQLTGRRFSGVQCWTEDYEVRAGQPRLQIARELDELTSVEVAGECTDYDADLEELTGACHVGNGLIRLHSSPSRFQYDPMYSDGLTSGPCGSGRETVRVTYRTLNTVPIGADRIVASLAEQYVLACHGDRKCKLPDRITSVNRQGVSWSMVDPMELFEFGKIGIGPIDQWLSVANASRSGLNGTITLHSGILRRAWLIGCGDACTTVGNWPVEES